jgi:hypothetical protein
MKSYEPQEIKLANEIAETLKDRDALPLFLSYTRKYQENHLRQVLAKVMSIPENSIRKSRGALFTFLINQHGNANHTGA